MKNTVKLRKVIAVVMALMLAASASPLSLLAAEKETEVVADVRIETPYMAAFIRTVPNDVSAGDSDYMELSCYDKPETPYPPEWPGGMDYEYDECEYSTGYDVPEYGYEYEKNGNAYDGYEYDEYDEKDEECEECEECEKELEEYEIIAFGMLQAAMPMSAFVTGDFYADGNMGGNLPWRYYDCGTLVLEEGVLPSAAHLWPHNNDLKKIVFTAQVTANAFMSNRFLGQTSQVVTGELNNLTAIEGLNHLDTRNVSHMLGMFSNAEGLTSLDLSSFDTGNTIYMHGMFMSATGLISLDLSNFNTGNVANMRLMFYGASSLTTLDISGFDTRNVTNMDDMFTGANNLHTLTIGPYFIGPLPGLRGGNWTNTATNATLSTQALQDAAPAARAGTWRHETAPPLLLPSDPDPPRPPIEESEEDEEGSLEPEALLPDLMPPPDINIYAPTIYDLREILDGVVGVSNGGGYAVLDLGDSDVSGVDLSGDFFNELLGMDAGLVVIFPDGTLTLCAELVGYIANQDSDNVTLIIYLYQKTEIIYEISEILCCGDEVFNVQLLIGGVAVTYFIGRLAVTVEYDRSPLPGVWRIGTYGELYPLEFVFDVEEGLVTFFPDRLSNFIVGYSAEARIIAIFRAEGSNMSLYSRGRETMNLRDGQRLSSGDRLTTGIGSEIFIMMDNSSILKLGDNSQAEIVETGRNLEIQVQTGNALVRIDTQPPHHVTTVTSQNVAITVRGTMFTVNVDETATKPWSCCRVTRK